MFNQANKDFILLKKKNEKKKKGKWEKRRQRITQVAEKRFSLNFFKGRGSLMFLYCVEINYLFGKKNFEKLKDIFYRKEDTIN